MTYSLTTREGKGSKLTISEMDNNLLYLQALAASASAAPIPWVNNYTPIFLTYDTGNNTTIPATASIIYVSNTTDNVMNLVLATASYAPLIIIRNDPDYFGENSIQLNGEFFAGGTTYLLNATGYNVSIAYDGTYWHVLSSNSSD